MKILTFLSCFLVVTLVAAPRLAAGDPEPIGAEAGLFIFGAIAAAFAAFAYGWVGGTPVNAKAILISSLAGLMAASLFFGLLAASVPALGLFTALALALVATLVFSAGAARLLRVRA